METTSPPNQLSERRVYIVSDGTGITAETFAHSVLTQFTMEFSQIRLAFIDSVDKAKEAKHQIERWHRETGLRPIVFSTLVNPEVNEILNKTNALVFDLFQMVVVPLETELGIASTHTVGRSHQNHDTDKYRQRIDAINFSLEHDDGQSHKNLAEADIILVGVSRCGKTPTSLYLAMQYGIKAANYPLIPEDFERNSLPKHLVAHKAKIFGLTIDPIRLSEIRNERRPGSKYATLDNCRYEVNAAEALMKREQIRWLSSTHKSIEEIATTILQEILPNSRIL